MSRKPSPRPTKIKRSEAISFLENMVNVGEENCCGKTLNLVIEQHPQLYLKYVTIRDRRK